MTNNFTFNFDKAEKINTLIIIPSYKEIQALPKLINELSPSLLISDAILIMDDSPPDVFLSLQQLCINSVNEFNVSIFFINQKYKSGRGSAVRNGMQFAVTNFPKLKHILECDADGSHRPVDILYLKNSPIVCDLLIGSRYLKLSEIKGWSTSRRLFSLLLNFIIPNVLSIEVSDITNGLRRYSIPAIVRVLNFKQINVGFTYLSEQALIIERSNLVINELPIVFVDRTYGKSTVTLREIIISLKGIFLLIRNRNVFNKRK